MEKVPDNRRRAAAKAPFLAACAVCVMVFFCSCAAILNFDLENSGASAGRENETAAVYSNLSDRNLVPSEAPAKSADLAPTEESDGQKTMKILPSFIRWLEINPDVVGFITFNNTDISVPVLFNGDNEFYLNHNMRKQEYKWGSIFMDAANHGALLSKNTFIHGHNFDDGIQFSELMKFKDRDFFFENQIVRFNNLYSEMEWKLFAIYVIASEDNFVKLSFESDEDFLQMIEKAREKALIWDDDYIPAKDDIILSINTCSSEFEDAHTILHARLIKKTDYFGEAE